MKIEQGKVVTLKYELREENKEGVVVEKVEDDKPFVFLYGAGHMIPKFEENLAGLKAEDAFEFAISSEDAYGDVQDDAIIDIPKNIFEEDGEMREDLIEVGQMIPMQDEDGNHLNGIIVEVGDSTVKMDFNHPMAGVGLHFTGSILEVREASQEEIDHGHAHGPEGHDH